MHHLAAITASLIALGLVCAIYYINILSSPGSWLRADLFGAILLALLTGLFPMALGASLLGLWSSVAEGGGLSAILSAGVDLASLGVIVATVLAFRALVRATYRTSAEAAPPRPLAPEPVRKAA